MAVTGRTRAVLYKYHTKPDRGAQHKLIIVYIFWSTYQWLCWSGVPASRRWRSLPWRSGWRPPAPACAVASSLTRTWNRAARVSVVCSVVGHRCRYRRRRHLQSSHLLVSSAAVQHLLVCLHYRGCLYMSQDRLLANNSMQLIINNKLVSLICFRFAAAPETTTPPPRHHHTPPFCPSPLCRHRLPPHLPRPIYPPPTPLSPESPPLPPPPPVVTPPRESRS